MISPVFRGGKPLFIPASGPFGATSRLALKDENTSCDKCCIPGYDFCTCGCAEFMSHVTSMTLTISGYVDFQCIGSILGVPGLPPYTRCANQTRYLYSAFNGSYTFPKEGGTIQFGTPGTCSGKLLQDGPSHQTLNFDPDTGGFISLTCSGSCQVFIQSLTVSPLFCIFNQTVGFHYGFETWSCVDNDPTQHCGTREGDGTSTVQGNFNDICKSGVNIPRFCFSGTQHDCSTVDPSGDTTPPIPQNQDTVAICGSVSLDTSGRICP